MDIAEIKILCEKLLEAREAGYGATIDSYIEQGKFICPNPAMFMAELEQFVQRAKTVIGDFPPHWLQDMNSRIDSLCGEVKDIWYIYN